MKIFPTCKELKQIQAYRLNSFLANGNFGHLLITFANSLDPDQDQQNFGLDLDQNSEKIPSMQS